MTIFYSLSIKYAVIQRNITLIPTIPPINHHFSLQVHPNSLQSLSNPLYSLINKSYYFSQIINSKQSIHSTSNHPKTHSKETQLNLSLSLLFLTQHNNQHRMYFFIIYIECMKEEMKTRSTYT